MTLDSLVNSESAATVTDIGGIAGSSTGVIRDCVNRGNVGYQHMGYNIGGIAGTQSGHIVDCENRGDILGRKEVGGIVGQMEPAALIEYDEDALQILRRQLNGLSSIVSKTSSNVQSTGDALYGQVEALQNHVWDARDSVGLLIPDPDDPQLPDQDAIDAAKNGLSSSLSGMTQTLEGMSATAQSSVGTLSNNLQALQNQINAMGTTLNNVSETLGGSIEDVSDADTADDLTGKVSGCANYGAVLADLNVGGIAGAMALENDLDPEDDWEILGDNSLNFKSQLRAVIRDCENRGTVTAGKRAAGGIVGWQSMGLVADSRNAGLLDASGAEYVGGISGQSLGYIRHCSANCRLSGGKNVGGIAGSAAVATDCRSLVHLDSGSEKLGAILGSTEDNLAEVEDPIGGNYYLAVYDDIGGIDGVSYDGMAQPLTQWAFFQLEELPELFRTARVTFCFADGTETQLTVSTGERLKASQFPALPERSGAQGKWEGLEGGNTESIFFDQTFTAVYTSFATAIESDARGANDLPLLLIQGQFGGDTTLTVTEAAYAPAEGETLLGAWTFALSQPDPVTAARLQLPAECDPQQIQVRIQKDGQWQSIDHTLDGSYAVFPLDTGTETIALTEIQSANWYLPAAAVAAALDADKGKRILFSRSALSPQDRPGVFIFPIF